jgi:hypothetical protein
MIVKGLLNNVVFVSFKDSLQEGNSAGVFTEAL